MVASAVAVSFAAGDPSASRLVYAMVVGLVMVGAGFVALGAWLVRRTRRDLDLLAPLDLMGDSDWARQDPGTQARLLDAVRPQGAVPLRRSVALPRFDSEFDQARALQPFDDLGPGLAPVQGATVDETNDKVLDETFDAAARHAGASAPNATPRSFGPPLAQPAESTKR